MVMFWFRDSLKIPLFGTSFFSDCFVAICGIVELLFLYSLFCLYFGQTSLSWAYFGNCVKIRVASCTLWCDNVKEISEQNLLNYRPPLATGQLSKKSHHNPVSWLFKKYNINNKIKFCMVIWYMIVTSLGDSSLWDHTVYAKKHLEKTETGL